jgi:tetratricopeptide (TPR) repeat protein
MNRFTATLCALILLLPATICAQENSSQALHMCMDGDPVPRSAEGQQSIINGCSFIIDSRENYSPGSVANAYLRRAGAQLTANNYKLAIEDYDELTDLAPRESRVYRYRGIAWSNLSQYNKAIRDYDRALKLNPDDAHAWYLRGYAYSRKDKHKKAIKDFSQAIVLMPEFMSAYNSRGRSYIILGDCDKAIADLNTTIELKPDHALAYADRAECHDVQGREQEALADYLTGLALTPENPDMQNFVCWAKALAGDGEAALPHCNQAIEMKPEVAEFYDSRALAWYRLGEYDKALADEQRSMSQPSWENHALRAAIYFQTGDLKAAKNDYKKARKLQRDRKQLQKRFSQLGIDPGDF